MQTSSAANTNQMAYRSERMQQRFAVPVTGRALRGVQALVIWCTRWCESPA